MSANKRRKVDEVFAKWGWQGVQERENPFDLSITPRSSPTSAAKSLPELDEDHSLESSPRSPTTAPTSVESASVEKSATLDLPFNEDEVLLRMGVVGRMNGSGLLADRQAFILARNHRLVGVHKGLAVTLRSFVNFVNSNNPTAKLSDATFVPDDLFAPLDSKAKQFVASPKNKRPYLHGHVAMMIAEKFGLGASITSLLRLDARENVPTTFHCATCYEEISTEQGPNDATMHTRSSHPDLKKDDAVLSCCIPCGLIFVTKADALQHVQTCDDLQNEISCNMFPTAIPPLSITSAIGTGNRWREDTFEELTTAESTFREAHNHDSFFLIRIRDKTKVELSGLVAMCHAIPIEGEKGTRGKTLNDYKNLEDPFLNDKFQYLARAEPISFERARNVAAAYGLLDVIRHLEELEDPFAHTWLGSTTCFDCGRLIQRLTTATVVHPTHCSAAAEHLEGHDWNSRLKIDLFVSECSEHQLLFWSDGDFLEHMKDH